MEEPVPGDRQHDSVVKCPEQANLERHKVGWGLGLGLGEEKGLPKAEGALLRETTVF